MLIDYSLPIAKRTRARVDQAYKEYFEKKKKKKKNGVGDSASSNQPLRGRDGKMVEKRKLLDGSEDLGSLCPGESAGSKNGKKSKLSFGKSENVGPIDVEKFDTEQDELWAGRDFALKSCELGSEDSNVVENKIKLLDGSKKMVGKRKLLCGSKKLGSHCTMDSKSVAVPDDGEKTSVEVIGVGPLGSLEKVDGNSVKSSPAETTRSKNVQKSNFGVGKIEYVIDGDDDVVFVGDKGGGGGFDCLNLQKSEGAGEVVGEVSNKVAVEDTGKDASKAAGEDYEPKKSQSSGCLEHLNSCGGDNEVKRGQNSEVDGAGEDYEPEKSQNSGCLENLNSCGGDVEVKKMQNSEGEDASEVAGEDYEREKSESSGCLEHFNSCGGDVELHKGQNSEGEDSREDASEASGKDYEPEKSQSSGCLENLNSCGADVEVKKVQNSEGEAASEVPSDYEDCELEKSQTSGCLEQLNSCGGVVEVKTGQNNDESEVRKGSGKLGEEQSVEVVVKRKIMVDCIRSIITLLERTRGRRRLLNQEI